MRTKTCRVINQVPMVTISLLYVRRMIVILSIILIATGNTGQCLPSEPCEKLSDIRIRKLDGNLENVFAAPSWVGNSTRTAASNTEMTNIPVKIHLFLNTSEPSHVRRLTQTQEWIDTENANGSALLWAYMQIGLNFSDIKIKIYLPSADSLNANMSLQHVEKLSILNATEWKKLGERAIMTNNTACQSKTEINFTGTGTIQKYITDNSCPSHIYGTDAEYHFPCKDLKAHFDTLCGLSIDPPFYVDQGDVFNYKIKPNTPYGNTTVKLVLLQILLGRIVFESNKIEDTFQFKKGGVYRLEVGTDSTTNFSRQITFYINKKCTSIKEFVSNWVQSSLTTLEQVHILLTINRIEPINYGVYEYLVHSPSKIPSATVLIKNLNGADSSVWAYLAEAFGAVIRKEGILYYSNRIITLATYYISQTTMHHVNR